MKPITDEDRDAIEARYLRGQGLNFIAYALGIGRDRVRAVLADRGVEMRRARGGGRNSWGWTGRHA